MRIIPAIDLINGQCVRLTKGDYSTENVQRQPAGWPRSSGARIAPAPGDPMGPNRTTWSTTRTRIATRTALKVDFGGGIKSTTMFASPSKRAHQITGSIAAKQPELFAAGLYGSDKIILGADSHQRK